MKVVIGIDVGQKVDPTAIAVDQVEWREPVMGDLLANEPLDHHIIRHLERLPLGTTYPDVAVRLKAVVDNVYRLVFSGTLRSTAGDLMPSDAPSIKVYVDATGVGQGVVDILRAAGVVLQGVYFTGGDQRLEVTHEVTKERMVKLGKAFMVSKMQVLMQTNRLHLPGTDEAKALAHELSVYEIKVDKDANDTYGAFKTGAHDDLVTAVGLCVQAPVLFMGGMASTPGVKPKPTPEWAAEYGKAKLTPFPGEIHALDRFRVR